MDELPEIIVFCEQLNSRTQKPIDILRFYREEYHKIHPGIRMELNENPLSLKIQFSSLEYFIESHHRIIPIFDKLMSFVNEGVIGLDQIDFSRNLTTKEDIFLILRNKTNMKEEMKKVYDYTFPAARMLNMGVFYEEVIDGFLVFYQTEEDYIDLQRDKLNPAVIVEILKRRGIWKPQFKDLLEKMYQQ